VRDDNKTRQLHNHLYHLNSDSPSGSDYSYLVLRHWAMTTLRRTTAEDLFHFNNVNLDHLTETYNTSFYMQYLSRWPHLCLTAEAPGGEIMGYRESSPNPIT